MAVILLGLILFAALSLVLIWQLIRHLRRFPKGKAATAAAILAHLAIAAALLLLVALAGYGALWCWAFLHADF
jgi:uncharacterized membrane protein YqhA